MATRYWGLLDKHCLGRQTGPPEVLPDVIPEFLLLRAGVRWLRRAHVANRLFKTKHELAQDFVYDCVPLI